MNTDPRYIETGRILDNLPIDVVTKLYKTTRAGVTTGLCANAIDKDKPFVLIAPTRKIAHETIKDAVRYCNKDAPDIETIVGNHECEKNKAMVKKYPDVGKIPVLPLPEKCDKCKRFEECEVTKFIRAPINEIDGVGLTHQKLVALMHSTSETAEIIREKLMGMGSVIIIDEAHTLETGDMASVEVFPYPDINKFAEVRKKYKILGEFMERFDEIRVDKDVHIQELVSAREDAEGHRMAIDFEEWGMEVFVFEKVVSAIKTIVKVMMEREKFNLDVDDVLYMYKVVMMISGDQIVLHYVKGDDGDHVYMSARDGGNAAFREFMKLCAVDGEYHRVVYTSATFGEFYYGDIFGTFQNEAMMKDVMESNQKMNIYADTFRMNTMNFARGFADKIIARAIEYETKYPGIRFICMKKNVAFWLKKRMEEKGYNINIDYYRSVRTIGVASEERRCVCVGEPVSPINAFDGVAKTYEESQKLRIGSCHAAFYQAISRVKDPSGKEESNVYCIGIKEEEIRKMCKWGKDRKIILDGTRCANVEIDEKVYYPDTPNIVSVLSQNVLQMIKAKGTVSRRDIMKKFKINKDTLISTIENRCLTRWIQCIVEKGKTKPKYFYKWGGDMSPIVSSYI